MTMRNTYCPKCRTRTMSTCEVEGTRVEVDACSTCNGIWFDAGELETLLDDLAVEDLRVPKKSKSEPYVCPRCHKAMFSFNYPQTYAQIDMCRHCRGIWLDANEFEEINMVRQKRQNDGTLEEHVAPDGIKGALINYINNTLSSMTDF